MTTERQQEATTSNRADNIVQFPLQRSGGNNIWASQGFYTSKEAARIARIHPATVTLWDKKGIIVPTLIWTDENGKENRGYSFADLIYLRLLRMLRNESVPLRKAVIAVSHLVDVFGPPGPNWEDARIFSDGHDLWVDHKSDWGVTAATRHGQRVADELFGPEFDLLRERADALLVPHTFSKVVEIDPSVKNGHPMIRRTSIKTGTIYSLRKQGLTYAQIRAYYPHLTRRQIVGAGKYEQSLDVETFAA